MSTTITEFAGYRQTYTSYGQGSPGYSARVIRLSDGAQMWHGPGTDPDHPRPWHHEWVLIPLEERRAILAVFAATDELVGIADYLAARAGRDARQGYETDPASTDQGLDAVELDATRNEHAGVLAHGIDWARARLASTLGRPLTARCAAGRRSV